jgi:hypothetical protein
MASNNNFRVWTNGIPPYSFAQNQGWQDDDPEEDQSTSEDNIAYPVQPAWGNAPQPSGYVPQQNPQPPRPLPQGYLPSPRREFAGWEQEQENQWHVLLVRTINGEKEYQWVLKR